MSVFTSVPRLLPRIASVEALEDRFVRISWNDGERAGKTEVVDLSPAFETFKIYKAIRDSDDLFRTVRVVNFGDAIGWGPDEVAMSAVEVERLAQEMLTAAEFREFLKLYDLTHAEAGGVLGRSRRQIENYLAGSERIPRVVVMACFGYVARRFKITLRPTAIFYRSDNVAQTDTAPRDADVELKVKDQLIAETSTVA